MKIIKAFPIGRAFIFSFSFNKPPLTPRRRFLSRCAEKGNKDALRGFRSPLAQEGRVFWKTFRRNVFRRNKPFDTDGFFLPSHTPERRRLSPSTHRSRLGGFLYYWLLSGQAELGEGDKESKIKASGNKNTPHFTPQVAVRPSRNANFIVLFLRTKGAIEKPPYHSISL